MKLRSVFSTSHRNILRGYVTDIPLVYSTLVPIQTINLNNVVFDIYIPQMASANITENIYETSCHL